MGKILTGARGRVVMADGIRLLELPTTPVIAPWATVHPLGNPHFWLDPENARVMAAHLTTYFPNIDAKDAGLFFAPI